MRHIQLTIDQRLDPLQADVDWLMNDYNSLISEQIGWVLKGSGAVLGYGVVLSAVCQCCVKLIV